MRTLVGSCVLVMSLAVVLNACAPAQKPAEMVDTAAIKASIDSLNKVFTAAVAARDTDAVTNCYADDARLMPANEPRSDGHQAIRASWARFLSMPGLSLNIATSDVMVASAGDMAVDVGSYTMQMQGPKGPIEDVGKYVTVFKKTDGQWKIVVDTFNSDKPLPGQ